MTTGCFPRIGWLAALTLMCGHAANFSHCDANQDGNTNVSDVQIIVNQALGVTPATNDLNGDSLVNVADVQIAINAALGFRCIADPGIISIVPNNGLQGSAVNVTITGSLTSFTNNSTVGAGPGITVSNIAAVTATTLTATFTIASNAAFTTRDLTVNGLTLASAFTVAQPSSVAYTYDTQGRLATASYTSLTGAVTLVTYSYDAAGNRTSVVVR